jgi:hypothetical protein
MPFKETTKKKDEFTNIFDDSYKYSPPLTEKKKENTMKIFTTGELKSNIVFDDQYVIFLYLFRNPIMMMLKDLLI